VLICGLVWLGGGGRGNAAATRVNLEQAKKWWYGREEGHTCLLDNILVNRGRSATPGCKRVRPDESADEHDSVARIQSSRWERCSKDVVGGRG
jgi:hypothetical protein